MVSGGGRDLWALGLFPPRTAPAGGLPADLFPVLSGLHRARGGEPGPLRRLRLGIPGPAGGVFHLPGREGRCPGTGHRPPDPGPGPAGRPPADPGPRRRHGGGGADYPPVPAMAGRDPGPAAPISRVLGGSLAVVLWFLGLVLAGCRHYRRLRRHLQQGQPLDHQKPWQPGARRRLGTLLVTALLLGGLVVWLVVGLTVLS